MICTCGSVWIPVSWVTCGYTHPSVFGLLLVWRAEKGHPSFASSFTKTKRRHSVLTLSYSLLCTGQGQEMLR